MSLRSTLTTRFGGLGPTFWAIQAGLLLNRAGQFVQPMLLWWLTGTQGLSTSAAGAVVSVYGLGGTVGTTLGGVVADRWGRKVALVGSASGAMLGLLALSAAPNIPAVVLCAFGLALVYELHRPAVYAMVADLIPPADRTRAYALMYVTVNLGFAVAPALAGLLSGADVRAPFYAAALVQALWGAFVLLRLPETRPAQAPGTAPSSSLRPVLADGLYLRWLVAQGLATVLPHLGILVLAAWMKGQGHSPAAYGRVLACNGLLIVFVQPWLAPIVGRLDPVRVQTTGVLLQGLGFAAHGLAETPLGHTLAVILWTSGELLCAPVVSAVVARLAPADLRGRYQGLLASTFAMAGVLGPLFGGLALDAIGVWVWPACLLLGLGAAAALTQQGPALRRRLAHEDGVVSAGGG